MGAYTSDGSVSVAFGRGNGVVASASFTPAAAAYDAADIMDVAKQFSFVYADGSPVQKGSLIRIYTTVLRIDVSALQASEAAYSLAMYNVTPPSAQADNAAWTLASADLSAYLGTLALSTPVDAGAALFVQAQPTANQDIKLLSTATSIYGELITTPAFTPTAVARQVTLYGVVL